MLQININVNPSEKSLTFRLRDESHGRFFQNAAGVFFLWGKAMLLMTWKGDIFK